MGQYFIEHLISLVKKIFNLRGQKTTTKNLQQKGQTFGHTRLRFLRWQETNSVQRLMPKCYNLALYFVYIQCIIQFIIIKNNIKLINYA